MIINKEGKLFGKISVIDIAAVLIVIVLALGIYSRFSGSSTTVVTSSGEKIQCTFLVKNVRMYTVEALEKGGPMYDKTSKEYIGDITDVKYEPGEYNVNMADGSYKAVVPEDRYNVYVTVEFSGKTSDKGYYTAANKYLAAGTTSVICTKYSQCEVSVDSIGKAE